MFSDTGAKAYPEHAELRAAELPANNSLSALIALAGEGRRVLDVGCAGGYLARALGARGCTVVGIDVNEHALEQARAVCSETLAADLDVLPLERVLGEREPFDVIVFGDVLEHLRNPLPVLESARAYLRPGGFVVASIPNFAHGAVRLAMLDGKFDYQEFGLLDESHVRFFTRKTVDELFLSAGYRIDDVTRVVLPLFEASDLVPAVNRDDYAAPVLERVTADPEHQTLQFVVRASPLSEPARTRALARAMIEAGTQCDAARVRLDALERERATLQEAVRNERERAERGERDGALHLAARERADLVIAASSDRIRTMQQRLDTLEAQVSGLLAEREATARALAAEADARKRLEREIAIERDARDAREAEVTALRRASKEHAEARMRLQAEAGAAQAATEALELRFMEFAAEVESRTLREIQALSAEIDAIQSGYVWGLKRFVRRVLRPQ